MLLRAATIVVTWSLVKAADHHEGQRTIRGSDRIYEKLCWVVSSPLFVRKRKNHGLQMDSNSDFQDLS